MWRWPASLGILMVSLGFAADVQSPALTEYDLKAAFLYHFARFVEWPTNAFSNATSPFVIGVLGDSPFDDKLDRLVQKKDINGHPFVVRAMRAPVEAKNCHLLFICDSERKRVGEIIRLVRDAPVLTVSDIDHFLTADGMIELMMEGNKVRFAINNAAAKQAGLRISTKLLSLSKRPERKETE